MFIVHPSIEVCQYSDTLSVVTLLATIEAPAGDVCCTPLTKDTLGADQAGDLARTFKALSDPTRLRLLSIVAASADEEACVCDLIEPVGLSQPTVSHHLKILMDAGFLTRSKRATWAYYKLVPGALDKLSQVLVAA